ncbi:aminotransferase class I/II-fold pyridoxal phosphate-dependent enzyme [Cupriavidus basilensis]
MGGDQVLIVNGAQQGLAVAVMALLKPGDVLAVDALTYPGMKMLAQAHRLDLEPVPHTVGGMDLDRLAALCKRRPVRAVYAMPTMHNPLGTVMAEAERTRLAGLAERHDFLTIIEDGAYAFLAEPAPKPVFTYAPMRTVYVSRPVEERGIRPARADLSRPPACAGAGDRACHPRSRHGTPRHSPWRSAAIGSKRWPGRRSWRKTGNARTRGCAEAWRAACARGSDIVAHRSSYYLAG